MNFFTNLEGGYSNIWKAIIRPPREDYEIRHLGPPEFKLKGKNYKRTDLEVINNRGLTLQCSHFEPVNRVAKQLPCVIYLHGNSSSRLEALHGLDVLLPENITLFCFDFAGCGKSEGDYISLGWYERDDVDSVIAFLRNSGTVSAIGLWGRSMGAVSALMHIDRDPSLAGVVIDSSFSDLGILSEELMRNHTKIPKLVLAGFLGLIKKTIESKAHFKMEDLVPLNHVSSSFLPALFISAKKDDYIDPHHTKDLYEKYAGDKNLLLVDGNHHSPRPKFLLDSIAIFFHNTLLVEQLPQDPSTYYSLEESMAPQRHQVHIKEDEDGYVAIDLELLKSKAVPKDYDVRKFIASGDEKEFVRALEDSIKLDTKLFKGVDTVEGRKTQEEKKSEEITHEKKEKESAIKEKSRLEVKLSEVVPNISESIVVIGNARKKEESNKVVQELQEAKVENLMNKEKLESLSQEVEIFSPEKKEHENIIDNIQETVILMSPNKEKKEKEEVPEEIIKQSMIIITSPSQKKEIEKNLKEAKEEKNSLQNSCYIIEEEKDQISKSLQVPQEMDLQESTVIIQSQEKERLEPKEKLANDDYEVIE